MSKQSAPRLRIFAVWTGAIAVAAVAAIAGSNHVHARKEAAVPSSQAPATATQRGRVRASLDALPLAFEANQGQTDSQVKYMARGNGYAAFLTANETVFAMQMRSRANSEIGGKKYLGAAVKTRQNAGQDATAAIRMKLVGANSNPQIVAENQLPGHSNYFIGNDPSKWQSGVQQYARVAYREVYPGVNLAFHGQQRQLEFDFVVAPGANAESIRFNISGAERIATDTTGDLVLSSAAGDVVLHKPVSYQTKGGAQEAVDSRFVVAKNTVGFEVANYDHGRELVIDPSVGYATYLGGSAQDDALGIAVDGSGNAYVTGDTASTNFPVVSGGPSGSNKGSNDVFVSKLSADGTTLEYSTYVGGAGDDSGNAIALDASGNIYVAGATSSTDFPAGTTPGLHSTFQGGAHDALIFELAKSDGSLVFSTYLGGSGDDLGRGVAVDASGVYVAGTTTSPLLASSGVVQTNLSGTEDGFVAKLNTSGSTQLYFTYLGAGGESLIGLAIDGSGDAYVTGTTLNASFPHTIGSCSSCPTLGDAFVSVLLPDASGFVYSTFLGGSGLDEGLGIAVDGSGDAYVTGATKSANFPAQPNPPLIPFGGMQNAFVTELNPTGGLVYSTFLGGSGTDMGTGIAVDTNKNAYVVGRTNSTNFPKANPTQATLKGSYDTFISEISASGTSLLFSTFLGGTSDENTIGSGDLTGIGAIAVDSSGGGVYVAGNTASPDFPVTAGVKQDTYGGNIDAYAATISNFSVSDGALSPTSGKAGVAADSTVTVTWSSGFNAAVKLACNVSPAVTKGPTCALSNSTVTPGSNNSASSTLNIGTTAATARLDTPFGGSSRMLYAAVLPVFGVTFVGGIGLGGSGRKKLFGLALLGILIATLMLIPACSSSTTTIGGGNGGTPKGSYTITVTGTSPGGTTVTGSPALTLTIN